MNRPLREALADFGEAVLRRLIHCYQDERLDEWCEDLTQIAHQYELAERVKYNPDEHGFIDGPRPGDEIWTIDLATLRAEEDRRTKPTP